MACQGGDAAEAVLQANTRPAYSAACSAAPAASCACMRASEETAKCQLARLPPIMPKGRPWMRDGWVARLWLACMLVGAACEGIWGRVMHEGLTG